MKRMEIIMSHGALGADEYDDGLDNILRMIAKTHGDEEHEWVSKYGTDFENETFMMHRFCWCDKDDCPWCGGEAEQDAPNFWYKPTDFKVWWYKYIGRGMETNRPIAIQELSQILNDCIKGTGATN
jgi:hypothetical protein